MKRRPTTQADRPTGCGWAITAEAAQPAFLDSRIRWRECFLALSSATYSSPRRETALRRRRGEGCIARLYGRLAAIGRQRLLRSELLLQRKSLTFDGFNYSRDKPGMAAEALVKFLAVPQLGRSVAS